MPLFLISWNNTNSGGKQCNFLYHFINHDHFYDKSHDGSWDVPSKSPFRNEESTFFQLLAILLADGLHRQPLWGLAWLKGAVSPKITLLFPVAASNA